MMLPSYTDRRFWLFDLDNTLYPPEVALFNQISVKMGDYIEQLLGLSADEAALLRDRYWHTYGATLTGLRQEHQIDAEDFLAKTHAIDFSHIPADPVLANAIAGLPGEKWVFTNSTRPYAEAVLEKRGMTGLFKGIFGLTELGYCSKPFAASYQTVLDATQLDPKLCVMFEDDPRNLEVPKALGMGTVLISDKPQHYPHIDHVTDNLAAFLGRIEGNSP